MLSLLKPARIAREGRARGLREGPGAHGWMGARAGDYWRRGIVHDEQQRGGCGGGQAMDEWQRRKEEDNADELNLAEGSPFWPSTRMGFRMRLLFLLLLGKRLCIVSCC
jgi:hypothetical protein